MYEVGQELWSGEISPSACPELVIDHQEIKNGKSPRGIKQIKLNHAEMQSHALHLVCKPH